MRWTEGTTQRRQPGRDLQNGPLAAIKLLKPPVANLASPSAKGCLLAGADISGLMDLADGAHFHGARCTKAAQERDAPTHLCSTDSLRCKDEASTFGNPNPDPKFLVTPSFQTF